ncbi:MAG: hypothetical protein D6731_07085 [Planctomycetota bacterium]|nr:MAG: hypothetical protein D6731_07085 [Planctomycetota bacterium]
MNRRTLFAIAVCASIPAWAPARAQDPGAEPPAALTKQLRAAEARLRAAEARLRAQQEELARWQERVHAAEFRARRAEGKLRSNDTASDILAERLAAALAGRSPTSNREAWLREVSHLQPPARLYRLAKFLHRENAFLRATVASLEDRCARLEGPPKERSFLDDTEIRLKFGTDSIPAVSLDDLVCFVSDVTRLEIRLPDGVDRATPRRIFLENATLRESFDRLAELMGPGVRWTFDEEARVLRFLRTKGAER